MTSVTAVLFAKEHQMDDSILESSLYGGKSYVELNKIFYEFRFINAIIGYMRILLRKGRQGASLKKHVEERAAATEIILAIFKYGIKNVGKKSLTSLRVRKKFKEKDVKEIMGLAGYMHIINSQKSEYCVTRKAFDEESDIALYREYHDCPGINQNISYGYG